MSGGSVSAADEELALEKHAVELEAEIRERAEKVATLREWQADIKRKRDDDKRREAERKEREQREEEEREAARERQRKHEAKVAARAMRGTRCQYSLVKADYVDENFNERVTCFATGDSGAHVLLYEDGDWMYTGNIPTLLLNKLKGRAQSHPKPVYVALGTQNRYYIKFDNGKSEWVGCEHMGEYLQKDATQVATVAFGDEWDSYFVVTKGGGYGYQSVPTGLTDKIAAREQSMSKSGGDLRSVSLGPGGEWCLEALNNRMWWGGLSSEAYDELRSIKDRVTFMDFGDDDSYFLRYE
jgi:hypothetical protein